MLKGISKIFASDQMMGGTYNHQGPARVIGGLRPEENASIDQPPSVEGQGPKDEDDDAQADDHLLCLLVLQSEVR